MYFSKHILRALISVMLISIVLPRADAQFVQQGNKLVGSGAAGNAQQGHSVSVSSDGNTVIVGGSADSNATGAAWIYTRAGNVWSQQGSKLVGTGAVGSAQQGHSVSLSADGNTAIVGGYGDNNFAGATWVFTRTNGVWGQQGNKLVGTDATSIAQQGYSVSLSADGNTAIVGGPYDDFFAGAAWVFTRTNGVWSQQGSKLVGIGAAGSAQQGYSVSLSADGNTAIVGGPYDLFAGAAWVFTRTNGVWSQQSILVGTGAVGGAQQGISVSLSADGNTAIVGGPGDNSGFGATWVFTRSGGVWSQQGNKLVGTGAVGSAQQGIAVSLSSNGDTAIAGGCYDNGNTGAAWVFIRTNGVWSQQRNKLVGTGAVGSARQGYSVSLSADGNTAIVGGPSDNSAGAAWVFVLGGSPFILSVKDVPNDQGGKVKLRWLRSLYDDTLGTPSRVQYYSIWRAIPLGAKPVGQPISMYEICVNFSGKAYRSLSTSLGYDWEWLANQPSHNFSTYAYAAATLYDSMSTTNGMHYFLVSAQTSDPNVYWDSEPDSGYSVDNLPPAAPRNVAGNLVAANAVFHWNPNTESDLAGYKIYRSRVPGFDPDTMTAYASTGDTAYTDTNVPPNRNSYYAIRTYDVHDNGSPKSNEVAIILVGVDDVPGIPTVFALGQNYPNPFNPSTTILYEVPRRSRVELIIYNIIGQKITTLLDEEREAGRHSVVWSGRNEMGADIGSGVYFSRIRAERYVAVRKLMLLR